MSFPQYERITTKKRLSSWVREIADNPSLPFAVDTETTSTDPIAAELVGVSLAIDEGVGCYIPVGHRTNKKQLDKGYVLSALGPLLRIKKYKKVLHNAVYDKLVLAKEGIEIRGEDDTMLMAYVLEARRKGYGVGMDELAKRHLKYDTIRFDEVCRLPLGHQGFADVNLAHATAYAAEDTDVTLRLFHVLRRKLEKAGLLHVYENIDRPLLEPLTEMAWNGAKINTKRLRALAAEWGKRKEEARQAAFACVDGEFDLGSPSVLRGLLFDKLGLPILSYTDSGQPSTDKDTLKLLAHEHEVAKHISTYREMDKLISTYALALPERVNKDTGRVHASINATVTRTGRFSSSEPNLQNIPIRTKEGAEIRQAFIAEKGNKLVAADYSQIELRVMAHASQDRKMVRSFQNGEDIHTTTATEVWGKAAVEAHTDRLRRAAKAVNFGLIFGQTEWGLSRGLGISVDEAEDYIASYFQKFPGVRDYMEASKEFARNHGYVETLFGRRLYVDAIHSNDPGLRSYGERQSTNSIIQGTAAELMRLAMPRVLTSLRLTTPGALLMLTVHDELLAEAEEAEAKAVADVMKQTMETAADGLMKWRVPIVADAKAGGNWREAH